MHPNVVTCALRYLCVLIRRRLQWWGKRKQEAKKSRETLVHTRQCPGTLIMFTNMKEKNATSPLQNPPMVKWRSFGSPAQWCVFPLTGPQQGCGGYLTEDNQSFVSPDSDSNGRYDKGLSCIWYIVAPENKLVNLTFNVFTLEGPSSAGSCVYDYVQVRRLHLSNLL